MDPISSVALDVISMDPGVTGAIAHLSPDGDLLAVHDMPIFEVVKKVAGKSRTRKHINVHGVGAILRGVSNGRAVIEQVGPMPKDGAIQAFSFGFGAGALHGAVGALELQLDTVTPQRWKKHFGLSADKNEARRVATRRWPAFAEAFKRVMDSGRAEAALIGLHSIETSRAAAAADTEF